MDKPLSYEFFFDMAFQNIKELRNPKAKMPEYEDLHWNIVVRQDIFDFSGGESNRYFNIVEAARKISIKCLNDIIHYYLQKIKPIFDSPNCTSLTKEDKKVLFVLRHNESGELLIFKETEDCNFWKPKGNEPPYIKQFMKDNGAVSCKYIYLMFDYAYLQRIGYNEEDTDPGKGSNLYSIKWFFETYYGQNEYKRFRCALEKYVESVNEYLGYILIRSLTPNAMVNFRKILEKKIITFPYDKLLKINAKNYYLSGDGFNSIRSQYLEEKKYLVALGNNDFSESLITAEWLFESMKEAKAIDLTVIGIGYFKAVEQLLYHLICLHSGENRKIKKDYSFKDLPISIALDEENIAMKRIDTSIGSIANFYKDNLDVLRDDLNFGVKKYIRESIFDYKELRNVYSHKNNIHDWAIIDNIRDATYRLFFLVIGAQRIKDSDLKKLGALNFKEISEYDKLCEYIDFHAGHVLFIDNGNKTENIFFACSDMHTTIEPNGYVKYSGVYIRELGQHGRKFKISEDHLPKTIFLGKFLFANTELVNCTPVKVKKIFEGGKFLGPSIVEENSFDY